MPASFSQVIDKYVKEKRFLVVPGAHDALSARIIQKLGFETYFIGGFPAVGARYGVPDVGLKGFGEIAACVRDIMAAHLELLDDPDLVDTARASIAKGKSAGFAWPTSLRASAKTLTDTGDARLASANGQISVEQALASITAKTANGAIRIGEVIRGAVHLESSLGGLEVGVRQGSAAWLDLNSKFGKVRNTLEATAGPQDSDDTLEIRARTGMGDISVHYSTDSVR